MIKVLMADDHSIMREGLKQLLALSEDIVVTGEANDGEQVMTLLNQGGFDILLLDMNMPGLSGLDLIAHIRDGGCTVPILVVTMHSDLQIAKQAMRAGASGYLTKDSDHEHLFAAIRKVAGGGWYIDPTLAEQVAQDM